MGNPFFYHQFFDDFDANLTTGIWTQTKTGNGTSAHNAADGGTALLTTNSSTPATSDIVSLQLPAASFTFTAGKKSFFLTRLQLSSATNAAFIAGLIQTTTTPFTVTDGLYFYKATGALNNLQLISVVGSTATTLTIPTSAYTLANSTYIDLGWFVDRNQQVWAFVGSSLVGYVPQSGTGSVNSAGVSILPPPGAVATMGVSATQTLYPTSTIWTPTTANLNLTIAIQSGTAASSTLTTDFIMASKER
jgi:hypothetical protein